MALKEIKYTVDIAGIAPAVEEFSGTQGDHRVTGLVFTMTDKLYAAVTAAAAAVTDGKALYRFDIYNGEGSVWSGEAAEIVDNTALSIELEERHTRFGGKLTVYLVISVLSQDNETEVELFSFPAVLRLKNRPEGTAAEGENYESLTGLAEQAKASEAAAAESKEAAANSATAAQNSAQSAAVSAIEAEYTLMNIKTSVDAALEEAKASGEFDGKDGISIKHFWDGTILWVTSAQGVSYADLKGEKGDTGPQGEKGDTGAAGKDAVIDQEYSAASENAQSGTAVARAVNGRMPKHSSDSGQPPFSQILVLKNGWVADANGEIPDSDYVNKYIDDNNWSQDNGFSSAGGFIATRNDNGNLASGTPTTDYEVANKRYVDNATEGALHYIEHTGTYPAIYTQAADTTEPGLIQLDHTMPGSAVDEMDHDTDGGAGNDYSEYSGLVPRRNINGNLYSGTPKKKNEVANKKYVDDLVGDIETALDNIIAMQEELIGGESE